MPPWLPEPGFGDFVGERRLSAEQIELIGRWVTNGAIEGIAADLPAAPVWIDDWQLGRPDLVLRMSPYTLAPEGGDLYRNFVLSVPNRETRYVQAVEFRPGNRSVHHVRILLDSSGQSRRLAERETEPGFPGMKPPAKFPPGHLLTWVPGKMASREPPGLSWVLEPETDLVLQIHMQRTGKSETLQPTIGLFFTNQPPSKTAFALGLHSELIDIPAGETNYVVERTFKLPADVEVLSVLPHLHYLGKEVQGFATKPDGSTTWLILIKDWDFNWQGEYRFRSPVSLPKGTVLSMRYTFDNSASNTRNPNHPPRRVVFGPQSADEMAELWLQVLPRNSADLAVLQRDKRLWDARETAAYYDNFLKTYPNDAPAHVGFGKVLGPLGQKNEARAHFETALRISPSQSEANYYLGVILMEQKEFAAARAAFERELQVDPAYYKAEVGLGLIAIEEQNLEQAELHFRGALRTNPKDPGVQQMLSRVLKAKAEPKK